MIAFALTAETRLADFYAAVYEPINGACSDSTRRQFAAAIARCDTKLGRETLIGDLSDDLIAAVTNAMLRRGRSPATANGVRAKLCALMTLAAKRGIATRFPTIPRHKEYQRVPTAWTKDQLARLWLSLSQEEGTICEMPAAKWWLNLHGCLWDSGVRIGALVKVLSDSRRRGLEWTYLDLGGRSMRIVAETQKQRADQVFRLHADTAAALRDMKPRHSRYVFPWPWCEGTLYNRYGKILERADLPCGPRDKFHRMRRSVASWYEAAGGNATKLLGHSARKVTAHYLDPLIVGEVQASDLLFRPRG